MENRRTMSNRVCVVLYRLRAIAADDEDEAESMAGLIESMLDELASEDFFGTEQQLDPRGDFRDGHWGMWHVQGVDEE